MNKIILNKLQLIVLSCTVFLGFAVSAYAQSEENTVTGTLVDEQGNPLQGVLVNNPGGDQVTTDSAGYFEIQAETEQFLLFEKNNYETQLLNVSGISDKVTLEKVDFLSSDDDLIKMGIATKHKREMTGAVSTISPKDHLTYDHTQWVGDYIQGMLLGVQGSYNVRGLGGALYVIDGVIGRSPDILNMEEVDQITVLKDANAIALYGNQAANGVIIINTKRGQINKKYANVNVRYGIRKPISLPKYLESAEYMELYNEARTNDGLDPVYAPELIAEYRSGNNPYRYPNVDYYSDEYLRSVASRADVVTEFSSGNEKSQYYVNMGWNFNQSLVGLNPDVNVGNNRFNIRGNIDFKVNDWIKSSVDAVAIISNDKSALTNWFSNAATTKPNAYAPLLPPSMVYDTTSDGSLTSQLRAANLYNGMYLGTAQAYQEDSPIANTLAGGYNKTSFRSTQFNNSIDFDLDMIVEGLSARTYLSFDFYDSYNISIENDYQRYEPDWSGDSIVGLTAYGDADRPDLSENFSTNGFVSRLGFYALLNYQKELSNDQSLNTSLIGYVNSHNQASIIQPEKNSHIGFQFSYDYQNKMFVDFSSAYVHSTKLPKGNRNGFSPTLGFAYILSEEDFIQSKDFINFLKVKASAGIIKSDIGIDEYYLYENTYSVGDYYNWADGVYSSRTRDSWQAANDEMTFEDRLDLNLGFESVILKSFWLEFNVFKTNKDKQLTKLNSEYPSFYTDFNQYFNYNKDVYHGFEFGLDHLKTNGDFSVRTGLNILYTKSKVSKRSEIYPYDYMNRVGNPVPSFFGLVDDGLYSTSDFTTDALGNLQLNADLPAPTFGAVQPGDIKYIDQNDDGVIDANDEKYIGLWSNPLSVGLNVKFSYKRLSLFILGTAESGGDLMLHSWGDNQHYDNYYWVDGNDKYSEVVLDRWTPETASSATYPRLSSSSNSNNYQASTYWLYDNSYFDISRAQLTYEPEILAKVLNMKALSVNISGSNLLRISKSKEYQQLNIGSNPQYRYFTVGIRTSF